MAPRIYTPQELLIHTNIALEPTASHHLCQVLRLKLNAELNLFNGDGQEYQAHIIAIIGRQVTVQLSHQWTATSESPLRIHLVQAMAKGEKMDYLIQKAVELGVTEFTALESSRTVVQLNTQRAEKRLDHWRSIMIAACEQCGRSVLPTLNPLVQFKDFLRQEQRGARLVFHPGSAIHLTQLAGASEFTVVIGPEGGFSDEELHKLLNAGYQSVVLGPRILRTETAGAAVIAAINTLWGDFHD